MYVIAPKSICVPEIIKCHPRTVLPHNFTQVRWEAPDVGTFWDGTIERLASTPSLMGSSSTERKPTSGRKLIVAPAVITAGVAVAEYSLMRWALRRVALFLYTQYYQEPLKGYSLAQQFVSWVVNNPTMTTATVANVRYAVNGVPREFPAVIGVQEASVISDSSGDLINPTSNFFALKPSSQTYKTASLIQAPLQPGCKSNLKEEVETCFV